MKLLVTLICLFAAMLLTACPQDSGSTATDNSSDSTGSVASPAEDSASSDQDEAGHSDDEHATADDASQDEEGMDGDAANPCSEETELTIEEQVKAPVEAMAESMRDYYGAGFRACFHPESPELEEMLEMYNEFKTLNQSVEITRLDINELQAEGEEQFAVLDYEFTFYQRPGNEEVKKESGLMTVVPGEDGNWLIIDLE